MVSSTSVYGQNQGEWIDEASLTEPESPCRALAGSRRTAFMGKHCVVRFSGIYGSGRDWLLRRASLGESIQQQSPTFTNRIHTDDCVAVLIFLLQKQLTGELLQSCYLASDDEPGMS